MGLVAMPVPGLEGPVAWLGSAMSVVDREADENVAYWGGEPARRDRGILVY